MRPNRGIQMWKERYEHKFGCCLRIFAVTFRWSILKAPKRKKNEVPRGQKRVSQKSNCSSKFPTVPPDEERKSGVNFMFSFLQVHFGSNFESKPLVLSLSFYFKAFKCQYKKFKRSWEHWLGHFCQTQPKRLTNITQLFHMDFGKIECFSQFLGMIYAKIFEMLSILTFENIKIWLNWTSV